LEKIDGLREKCDAIVVPYIYALPNPNYVWLTDCTATGTFFWDFDRPEVWTSDMEAPLVKKGWAKAALLKRASDAEDKIKRKVVGIETSATPAGYVARVKKVAKKVVDISDALAKARLLKTAYEIRQIKEACAVTREVFGSLDKRGTEAQIRARYDYEVLRRGLKPAFDTIVASGGNIATPHHIPTKKQARKPLLLDAGVRYKNYNSDVTRTWGSRFEKLIGKVFEAVEPGLKPGAKCSDIDKQARRALGSRQKHFITALGHGIGVAVHEQPWIASSSTDVLRPGMVFTIEPGIYVPGGIRVEHMYLMREDGAEKLTDW
jgi:Xaa-Pro aminopeptidase